MLSPQKTQYTDDIKLFVVLDGIYLLPLKNSSLFLIIYWTALAAAISLGLSTLTQHLFLVGLGHRPFCVPLCTIPTLTAFFLPPLPDSYICDTLVSSSSQ